MANSANFVVNGTKKIAEVDRVNGTKYVASIYIQGTFGGGTLALFSSIDQGQTLIPLKDSTNTAITVTANDLYVIELGGGDEFDEELYATLSGATAPNLDVKVNSNS